MLKVGLTGGLASGKTFVANCFAELGARVAHADRMGYEVLQPDGEAFEATIEEFGRGILRALSQLQPSPHYSLRAPLDTSGEKRSARPHSPNT